MPSTGFYPFLPVGNLEALVKTLGVNALNGLLSISTIESTGYFKTAWGVSMPSTGFYPFLPILKQENGKTFIVSMPSTGFYPFLHQKNILWVEIISSVNALNGLLSISTNKGGHTNDKRNEVSMPSTGFYPFLQ